MAHASIVTRVFLMERDCSSIRKLTVLVGRVSPPNGSANFAERFKNTG
jgi:hypothetical protein